MFCLIMACICVVIGVILFRFARLRIGVWIIAAMLVGIGRYDAVLQMQSQNPNIFFEKEYDFRGRVADEPKTTMTNTILIMDRVFVIDRSLVLEKAMELHLRLPIDVQEGDEMQWQCKPLALSPTDDGRFILRNIGWQCFLRVSPIVLKKVTRWSISSLLSFCRQSMRFVIEKLFSEPEASLLLGLLIGEREGIPPDIVADFRNTGTSHILAVSGYNVTQLVEVIVVFFAAFSLPRRRAAFWTAFVVFGFVILVGGEASVVRAGIMGCVGLLAAFFGRRCAGMTALLCAAAVMLAMNPLILRHDVGFQLSFAGVLGLHFLGPQFVRLFSFLPSLFGLRKICAETLAATIATMPVSLFVFGTLPIFGPLVNMLVVPVVPWAMGTGVLAVIFYPIPFPLASLLVVFTTIFIRFMEYVVSISAHFVPPLIIHTTALETAFLYFWIVVLWFALSFLETH